jgi:hypothetical protein
LSDSYSDYSELDVSHDKSQSVSTLSEENYCSHIHNNIKKEPEEDDVGSYYPGLCSIIQPSKAANQVNYRIITVTMLNSLEVIYGIFHII